MVRIDKSRLIRRTPSLPRTDVDRVDVEARPQTRLLKRASLKSRPSVSDLDLTETKKKTRRVRPKAELPADSPIAAKSLCLRETLLHLKTMTSTTTVEGCHLSEILCLTKVAMVDLPLKTMADLIMLVEETPTSMVRVIDT